MNDELKYDISKADGLIVSGYYPDKEILKYIKTPISFYTYSGTLFCPITEEIFGASESEFNSVMKVLEDEPEQEYFNNFTIINRKTRKFVKLNNYYDLYTIK